MFSEIRIGFLRGIGFALSVLIIWGAVAIIFFIVQYPDQAVDLINEITDYDEYVRFTSETKLKAETDRYELDENKLVLLGRVFNETDHTWKNIKVEAELFDKDEFVKECTQTLGGFLKPGDTEVFELSCGCCKQKSFPSFDRIDLKVTNAWSS